MAAGKLAVGRLLILFAWTLVLAPPVAAHHHDRAGSSTGGIPIPNITHGQMTVIADYRRAIVDLAASRPRTDPVLRRLANFANVQYAYCLWGLIPGSLSDENSPFNACMHAALAAARALLLHLQATGDETGAAKSLTMQIESDMLRNNASLTLCRYSETPFSTAQVISPGWGKIPFHLPSLAAFLSLVCALAAAIFLLLRLQAPLQRTHPL